MWNKKIFSVFFRNLSVSLVIRALTFGIEDAGFRIPIVIEVCSGSYCSLNGGTDLFRPRLKNDNNAPNQLTYSLNKVFYNFYIHLPELLLSNLECSNDVYPLNL